MQRYPQEKISLFTGPSYIITELDRYEKESETRNKKRKRDETIECSFDIPLLPKKRISQGEKMLANIWFTLDNMGYVRTTDQIEFNQAMVYACLPKIYGEDEWPIHANSVMEKYGLKKIQPRLLFFCPRRWGKTMSVAFFCAALMLRRPGIVICVFSTGGRISGKLMETMIQMILGVTSASNRIVKSDNEDLYLAATQLPPGCSKNSAIAHQLRNHSTTSKFFSYPNNPIGNHIPPHNTVCLSVCVCVSVCTDSGVSWRPTQRWTPFTLQMPSPHITHPKFLALGKDIHNLIDDFLAHPTPTHCSWSYWCDHRPFSCVRFSFYIYNLSLIHYRSLNSKRICPLPTSLIQSSSL